MLERMGMMGLWRVETEQSTTTLWSLGGMCVFMAAGLYVEERGWVDRGVFSAIHVFGRVPLFFYLVHLWVYRLRLPGVEVPFYLDLFPTLGVWVVGLVVLYLFCARYEVLKRAHRRVLQYV